MKFETLKPILACALLSSFLVACSSTPPSSSNGTGSGSSTIVSTDSGVATGSVDDGSLSGSDVDTDGGIETVFYFDFDQATLKPESLAALRIHAQRLIANPVSVRLEGHADERGTREYNMALGERRGSSVREFLVLQGVDASLLEVISYGEERPASLDSTDSSWALNRRVEIK
ncbi:MAG: OmpA family protein [Gammaproteobacteria bacterium]|nr:OmpA family protein [Gammaproteobacteria bacterium]MBQ0840712.1 OmpA family protein [Gammaproteobacteria bacterium]